MERLQLGRLATRIGTETVFVGGALLSLDGLIEQNWVKVTGFGAVSVAARAVPEVHRRVKKLRTGNTK